MDFLKQNKTVAGGGLVVILLGVVYFLYFPSKQSDSTLLTSDTVSPVSQNLLVTLQNLHTIKLDATLFTNPVFVSLTDFGVQIPPEAVGRRNPFIPLPPGGGSSSGKSNLTLPNGTQ